MGIFENISPEEAANLISLLLLGVFIWFMLWWKPMERYRKRFEAKYYKEHPHRKPPKKQEGKEKLWEE